MQIRTAKAGSYGCSPRTTTWPTPWTPTPTRNCWTISNRESTSAKKLEAKLIMPFIPHTKKDTEEMLMKSLVGIRHTMIEIEIGRLMRARASQDAGPSCFIGAGAYEHHIPAVVWDIATRGEFYSAYTPYQAEASQGTLQTIYEYQ